MDTEATQGSATLPRLVRVKTAAEMLCISRSQVYQLMASGQLPYVKLNRSRRIELAALEKLIAAGRVGS